MSYTCPVCGFQFGFDDDSKHISYEQWRLTWINAGMHWWSGSGPAPKDWNPRQQLRDAGFAPESSQSANGAA
jgi:hypothetical protein